MDKHIHIICLDIPFPANYGGAIDQFYKLKGLADAGWQITLHCFVYGDRHPQEILQGLCKQVHYYPRKTGLKGLHHSLPYMVSSRRDHKLLQRLQADDAPILFEGVHTSYYLNHPSLRKRKKIIRIHNIEADYYHQLGIHADSFLKKMYYFFESGRLVRYEKMLGNASCFMSISQTEYAHFKKIYPSKQHCEIPAFHGYEKINSPEGMGTYCIYHGNLEVEENNKAALFLCKEVFAHLSVKLIIAGKNPSVELITCATDHIEIIANPSEEAMNEYLRNAHIHVLPAMQDTGFKLKLLHSLFTGRYVIANDNMLAGSGLNHAVHLANGAEEFITKINLLMEVEFTTKHREERIEMLLPFTTPHLVKMLETCLLD